MEWIGPCVAALLLCVAAARTQYCDELHRRYDKDNRLDKVVSVFGKVRSGGVVLYWGDAASRAAAALLRARLRHALRYRRVALRRAPSALRLVYERLNNDSAANEVPVAVSAAWQAGDALAAGRGGVRLAPLRGGAAPARRRLLARLAPNTSHHCIHLFHAPSPDLADCGFKQRVIDGKERVVVYTINPDAEKDTVVAELERRAEATARPVHVELVSRRQLLSKLSDSGAAVLFLDYDMWAGVPGVLPAPPPACAALDGTVAVRAAELDLGLFDPQLYDAIDTFDPSPESIRRVLTFEADELTPEEAACKLATSDPAAIGNNEIKDSSFYVNVYRCTDDPDFAKYRQILYLVQEELSSSRMSPDFTVNIRLYKVENRTDASELSRDMQVTFDLERIYITLGVVACGTEGAANAARAARLARVPLLQYDACPRGAAPCASAGAAPLARALLQFARASGWTRLAIVSEPGALAADWLAELRADPDFDLHEIAVPFELSPERANETLRELRGVDARIVFVNAEPRVTAALLGAAPAAGMGDASRHAWLARDWRPTAGAATGAVRHFTFTYWSRGELPACEAGCGLPRLRRRIRDLWPGEDWPALTEPLVDAILTLDYAFKKIVRDTSIRYDFHTHHMMKKFESLMATESKEWSGLSRHLRYEASVRADPIIYVDSWRGAVRSRLGECGPGACPVPAAFPGAKPGDGTPRCLVRTGRGFAARCHDAALAGGLALLALLCGGAVLAQRVLRRHVARRELAVLRRLTAQRDRAASALAEHVVPRAALDLREELGAGRFGCVRLALLREPGRAPRVVAAKAPRAGAAPSEESEFLREACTLAALAHEHVVRLAGVVADEGPPLVLMEHAFFGDLLRYLRARRPLAEGAGVGVGPVEAGEAAHVAPTALTRLAREAGAALGYLALRGLVHRDVRAANCLVDSRRSLKLADFGMARETAAGADGAAEYACRRRALFPVLWMAPESLARGVFSAASDVWALGVLLLEIATLGERPYGAASPLRVLRFVASGGQPPLPPDATPQTRGVVQACWRRAAEQRPSAAELVAYLAAHPRALAPALAAPRPEPSDADSGFGEPPSPHAEPFHCATDTR